MGYIYKATSPSGKCYIGQTTWNIRQRQRWHIQKATNKNSPVYNTKFSRAIRKYGNSIVWEIMCSIPNSRLNARERKEIKKYNSYIDGYNSTPGGDGAGKRMSKLAKMKMSLAKQGVFDGKLNPMYNKHHTQLTKDKISQLNKGRLVGENNPRAKLSYEKARAIRMEYSLNRTSYGKLAKKYDVGKSTIARVITLYNWSDV